MQKEAELMVQEEAEAGAQEEAEAGAQEEAEASAQEEAEAGAQEEAEAGVQEEAEAGLLEETASGTHEEAGASRQEDNGSEVLGFSLEELIKGCWDSNSRTRLRSLKLILEHAPERAAPVLKRVAREDPEMAFRELARKELLQIEAREKAKKRTERKRGIRAPANLKYVAYWDYGFSAYFAVVVLLIFLWPPEVRPTGGDPAGSLFLRMAGGMVPGSVGFNLMACILCLAGARMVRRNTLDAWIIQGLAASCILFSAPIGPIIGAWMLYNVFKPDRF